MKNQSMNRIALAILVSGFAANGMAMQGPAKPTKEQKQRATTNYRQSVDAYKLAQARHANLQGAGADQAKIELAAREEAQAKNNMEELAAINSYGKSDFARFTDSVKSKSYELAEKTETKAREGYAYAKANPKNPKVFMPVLVAATGVVALTGLGIYKAIMKLKKHFVKADQVRNQEVTQAEIEALKKAGVVTAEEVAAQQSILDQAAKNIKK